MKPSPPNHQWIQTGDGSLTLYSERFQESCHSTSGAQSETLLHYVEGCKIVQRLTDHSPFRILEVGFGTGLGFLTTWESLKDNQHPWHFISLEIDRDLVDWFAQKYSGLVKLSDSLYEWEGGCFTLTVITGDARLTLPDYLARNPVSFHAIYQDAFSHRRNPTLWTTEWFALLRQHSSLDSILSTYSSSSSVRKSLLNAGWKLQKGEKFGPKRSSTRATLSGESSEEILLHLSRSPVAALSDDNALDFLKS